MPEISVIVPVYDVEKYLHRCIDSILAQTFTDFELILVDDGSPDNCPAICDEYAAKDSRVRVIHKENGGVSAARNAGLEMARGEYVAFVDSDDEILPCMYERLYHVATDEKADIVMCDAVTVYTDGRTSPDTITRLPETRVLCSDDFTPMLLKEFAGSVWRCLYRCDEINAGGITFPVGVKFSEDRIFNFLMMGRAKKIVYLKEPFYLRLVREESCVYRYHADYYDAVKDAFHVSQMTLHKAWPEEYQYVAESEFIDGAVGAINNTIRKECPLSRPEKCKELSRIRQDEELLAAIEKTGDMKNIDCLIPTGKTIRLLASGQKAYSVYSFYQMFQVQIRQYGFEKTMKKLFKKVKIKWEGRK